MRNRTAWLMWGLLLPTYFIVFFYRTSLSPIAESLAHALGPEVGVGTALGALSGMCFFVYAALQIPSRLVGYHLLVCEAKREAGIFRHIPP